MYSWKKMCEDRNSYSGLHEELRGGRGRYILDNVRMPESCGNRVCTIEFRYYGDDCIKMLCVEAPVEYTGSNARIARWLETGTVEFGSLSELDEFLGLFGSESVSPAVTNPRIPTDREHERGNTASERRRPPLRYDRSNITVPDADKTYIIIDKDRLILDLSDEIFGQNLNIEKIVHLVRGFLATKEKKKPLSIFIYGSPGVGKSSFVELMTKKLNEQLPSKDRFEFKQFDCTQIQHEEDISKLIGAAPGYVGYGEPGVFSVLEDNENAVFVFDDIERAAKNVTVTLMQAMENGKQSTNGKTLSNGKDYYDLSHSIMFFTSNVVLDDKKHIGFSQNGETADAEQDHIGETNIAKIISMETREAKTKMLEQGTFPRAVISRMNAIVKFNDLKGDVIIDIAAKCIRDTAWAHRLCVTEIETPILQEYIDYTAGKTENFGVRELREEAFNFFNEAFLGYALSHKDYAKIVVSGTLDAVKVLPEEQ